MNKSSIKSLTLVLGGIACLSLPALAETDPAKPKATTQAATPILQDSASRAKASAEGAASENRTPGTRTSGSQASGMGGTASPTEAGTGAQAAAQFTDADIISVVNAVDQHEIDAANRALKKKTSAEVQDYAKMLKKEHSDNMSKTKKLAKTLKLKPAKNATADTFKTKGAQELKTLASLKGAEFEKAYVDAMVTGHTEVLDMLDTKLIPSAQNDSLKSQLTDVRGHVAMHLEQGKRLQQASASKPAE